MSDRSMQMVLDQIEKLLYPNGRPEPKKKRNFVITFRRRRSDFLIIFSGLILSGILTWATIDSGQIFLKCDPGNMDACAALQTEFNVIQAWTPEKAPTVSGDLSVASDLMIADRAPIGVTGTQSGGPRVGTRWASSCVYNGDRLVCDENE